MTPALRVLVADDHPVFRKGLSALVASLPEAEVVGEAADGEQAVALAAALAPDVIVMDLQMPNVNGYLIKGSDTEDVVAAITAVGRGEAIFGPSVARRILSFLTKPLSAFDQQLFPELSSREREVLDLIAAGVGNADIAKRLFLSPKTVRNHVSSVFSKLQVADRAHAIVRARAAGLGQHTDPDP